MAWPAAEGDRRPRARRPARERAGSAFGTRVAEPQLPAPRGPSSERLAGGAKAKIAGEPAGEGRRPRARTRARLAAPSPTEERARPWRVMVRRPSGGLWSPRRVADRDALGLDRGGESAFAPRKPRPNSITFAWTAACPPWTTRPLLPEAAVDQPSVARGSGAALTRERPRPARRRATSTAIVPVISARERRQPAPAPRRRRSVHRSQGASRRARAQAPRARPSEQAGRPRPVAEKHQERRHVGGVEIGLARVDHIIARPERERARGANATPPTSPKTVTLNCPEALGRP